MENNFLHIDAKLIAKIIYNTDSKERPELFKLVAEELRKTNTNETAALFDLLTD